jgi:hypothetical protein
MTPKNVKSVEKIWHLLIVNQRNKYLSIDLCGVELLKVKN